MRNFKTLFLVLLTVSACSQEVQRRPLTVAGVTVEVEIAATPDERAQGLMYRKEVPEGTGMLFIFESARLQSFWMKNTYVPLSIAYIDDDGVIFEIHDMEPRSLAPVRSRRAARYALEVPRGYFSRAGIAVGDRLNLSDLPSEYRIEN